MSSNRWMSWIPTFHHFSSLSCLPPECVHICQPTAPFPFDLPSTHHPNANILWMMTYNTLTAPNMRPPQYPSCPSLSPCAASPCLPWTTWTGSSPSQLADFPAVVYNICYKTVRRVEQSTTTTIGISNCAVSRAWHCDCRKSLSHGIETVILTEFFLVGKKPNS